MADPVETPAAPSLEDVITSAPPDIQDSPEPANDTTPEPAKPNGKAEAAPAEGEAPPVSEAETLRQLAQKLGFEIEDRRLTTSERAAFRAKMKEIRQQVDAELQAKREAFDAEIAPRRADVEKADRIRKAYEVGDYEEIARALGAKDWNALQEDVIAKLADPNYKRLQELERKQKERDEREAREVQEREQRTTAEQRQRAIGAYKAGLAEKMAQSTDPIVRAMHDDPGFIDAVYRIQQEHWDGEQTISPERAIRMAARGTSQALKDELAALHKRLSEAFAPGEPANDNGAPTPAEPEKSPMKAPKPRTGPAPKPAAAAPGKPDPDSPEWKQYARKRMEEAAARDRIEEEKRQAAEKS